jgi:uncharacterized protein YggE
MNGRCIPLVGLVVLVIGSSACSSNREGTPASVAVTGSAEVKVVPDIIDLELGVEARHKDLGAAFASQESQVRRILEVARSAGVNGGDLQTGQLDIRPLFDTRPEGDGALKQYELRRSIGIRLHDPRTYEALLPRCLEAGANRVFEVRFGSSKQAQYREQARELAVAAARAKAVAMARKLGQEVGRANLIEEEPETPWSANPLANNVRVAAGGGAAEDGGTLALGQMVVRASVKIRFELE